MFVTDIPYIPTRQKMVCLCTVIDLFNNEPVAWNVSNTQDWNVSDTQDWNVSDTQDKNPSLVTIKTLSKKYHLGDSIIHSDRGVHFTNNDYVNLLKSLKVKQSM